MPHEGKDPHQLLKECRRSNTRKERNECFREANEQILDHLSEQHGNAAKTCFKQHAQEKLFGRFVVDTLEQTDHDIDDITGFDTVKCGTQRNQQRNIVRMSTEHGNVIFKMGGTTAETAGREVNLSQQAHSLANGIFEDTSAIINSDPVRGIIAFNELDGEQVIRVPDDYKDIPASEIADMFIFEAIIADTDRDHNTLREEHVMKHIDFDEADRQGFAQPYSYVPYRYLTKAKQEGVEEVDNVNPHLRDALKDNIEFYWNEKDELKSAAPEFFDDDVNEKGEANIDARINHLQETFDIDLDDVTARRNQEVRDESSGTDITFP